MANVDMQEPTASRVKADTEVQMQAKLDKAFARVSDHHRAHLCQAWAKLVTHGSSMSWVEARDDADFLQAFNLLLPTNPDRRTKIRTLLQWAIIVLVS